MKPNAQSKREERARRKKAGYVRFEVWIKPEWLEDLKRYVKRKEKQCTTPN